MPAPVTIALNQTLDLSGSPVVPACGAGPFHKLVRDYANFAAGWFSNSRFLDPYMVARGTDDSAADIADGSKISILQTSGQGRMLRAIFRWVRDNATPVTISTNPPQGFFYGFIPNQSAARPRGALNFGNSDATGFRNPGDTDLGGIWVPLPKVDGNIEVVFSTVNTFRGAGLGASSTVANQNASWLAPVEVLLMGATKVMFLPSGAGAPTFSATPAEVQVIAQIVTP